MTRCPSCAAVVEDTSRFCSSCGGPLAPSSATPTRTGFLAEAAGPTQAERSHPARRHRQVGTRLYSSDSTDQGRFIPGTMLAGRYRIFGLVGRGGMGEVYRADDLKLGQPVALKFLPEAVEKDRAALARFHNEARIARQISHPNVCRVHDIGEAE